jgi:uncharacterized tellurite resistance protein B-like protein
MSNLQLFQNLVNLAAADGKFKEEEVEMLARRAEHWKISDEEFETALAGISSGTIEISLPDSQSDKITLLKEMIRMMAVDGELSEIEKRLCATASARMDFSPHEFNAMVDQILREMD